MFSIYSPKENQNTTSRRLLKEESILRNGINTDKELPTFDDFLNNINESEFFKNKICNKESLKNLYKNNIIFDDFKSFVKDFLRTEQNNSNNIDGIIELENSMSELYLDKLKIEAEKNRELEEKITKLFDENGIGNNFCNYIQANNNKILIKRNKNDDANDQSQDGHYRKYTELKTHIINLFEKYVDNRNKLFTKIIKNIFKFKEKEETKELEILDIKDDIDYKKIFEFTIDAKIIILDMYLDFVRFLEQFINALKPIPTKNTEDNDDYFLLFENKDKREDDSHEEEPAGESREEPAEEPAEEPTEEQEVAPEPVEEVAQEVTPESVKEAPPKPESIEETEGDTVVRTYTINGNDIYKKRGGSKQKRNSKKKGGKKNKGGKQLTKKQNRDLDMAALMI